MSFLHSIRFVYSVDNDCAHTLERDCFPLLNERGVWISSGTDLDYIFMIIGL